MLKFISIKSLALMVLLLPNMAFAEKNLTIADAKGDWGVLAPFLHSARGPGFVYTSFVFDSLIWKDANGQLQPLLAKTWRYNASSQCYEFELHPKASWQDGQTVTAADVVFSFNYLKEHGYRFVDLSPISQVTRITQQQDGNQQGEAVKVCMAQDYAPFLTNIAASLPIIPEHIYKGIKDPISFSQQQATLGSGAYQMVEYNRAKGYYRLKAQANYHLGAPRYDEVRIVRMTPQAALGAMQKGSVDAISLPQPMVNLYRDAGFKVLKKLSNHPERLLFNHQALFSDKATRQGLAYLIDRQALVDIAFRGQAEVPRVGYRQNITDELSASYATDTSKAKSLLKASGWSLSKQGKWLDKASQPLTLRLLANPSSELLARAVSSQLEQAGFAVTLRLEPDLQLVERMEQGDFDLALLSSSHEGDLDRFRLMLTGQQQRGDKFLDDKQLLAVLDKQQQELDTVKRDALLLQAEQRYNQQLPSFPLVNAMNFVAFNQKRVNLSFTEGGIAVGIPLAFNKMTLFLESSAEVLEPSAEVPVTKE